MTQEQIEAIGDNTSFQGVGKWPWPTAQLTVDLVNLQLTLAMVGVRQLAAYNPLLAPFVR